MPFSWWDNRFAPIASGVGASVALRVACAASPLLAGAVTAAGALGSAALVNTLPVITVAPHPATLDGSKKHLGIRHVRGSKDGAPPLSVFYPTDVEPKLPVSWLPHNDFRYAEGIAGYAGLPTFLFSHMPKCTISGTRNARPLPLAAEGDAKRKSNQKFRPVVLFSHGLAGNYHMYSALAADLVAMGAIVVVVEHQDGSASFTRDHHPDDTVIHYNPAPKGSEEAELGFREKQLFQRIGEVRKVMTSIADGSLFRRLHMPEADIEEFTRKSWTGDERPIVMAGHSFGGATTLGLLAKDVVEGTVYPNNAAFKSGVLYDLWGWPTGRWLQSELEAKSKSLQTKIELLDSEQWNRWSENRVYLESLVANTATFPAIRRAVAPQTDHMSASDMGLLLGRMARKGYTDLSQSRLVIHRWAKDLLNTLD